MSVAAEKPVIMFVSGIQDNGVSVVSLDDQGRIRLDGKGSSNLQPFLDVALNNWFECKRVLVSAENLKSMELKQQPILVVNEVSDPDSHAILLKQLSQKLKSVPSPVINSPSQIELTKRSNTANILAPIKGVRVPHTIECRPQSVAAILQIWQKHFQKKPVILRAAGDHGGKSTLKLTRKTVPKLDQFALDGRVFTLSEYIDYKSEDGLYRKYRFALVAGRVILRHMIVSNHWMIHSRSRNYMDENPQYYDEEQSVLDEYLKQVPDSVLQKLSQINELVGLDYIGLDCTLRNNEILVFELNANMNILVNTHPQAWRWEKSISKIAKSLAIHLTDIIKKLSAK
ncbi:hypothetical protein [Neptuniibacter sp.]|uniref:hypothetical protein n=1 Tax=Neptuniibacter sp. TaxID=1962643 RepID=UPI002622AC61|nr:hypothetical protein [Neptuniibacter sp.]MCP4597010.1 hypothetical protein [Neptuniibacter sp.]